MPSRSRARDDLPVLSLRELNRATLARQLLLRRRRLGVLDAIERLTPLQAQWSSSPYLALWSRVAGFRVADLMDALATRRVVKATLMRGTLHLVTTREYPAYARLITDAREALYRGYLASVKVDLAAFRRRLHAYASEPRDRRELLAFAERTVARDWAATKYGAWPVVVAAGGYVHAPPSGHWGSYRGGRLVSAAAWIGEHELAPAAAAYAHVARRYLAAFGPAALSDLVAWSRMRPRPLREGLDALGGDVVRSRDERGRTLYDLRDAPRPGPDVRAPVRFLPKWDQLLLAYDPKDRVRVLPERLRPLVIAKNGDVVPTVLVDGVVAARWDARLHGATAVLTVEPYGPLARADRAEVEAEGLRLLRFIHPEARARAVRFGGTARTVRYNLGIRP